MGLPNDLKFEDYFTPMARVDFERAWADGYRGVPLADGAPGHSGYPHGLGATRATADAKGELGRLSEALNELRRQAEDERDAAPIRALTYPVTVARVEDRWGYIWEYGGDECEDYDDVLECFKGEDGGTFRLVAHDGAMVFVEGKAAGSNGWRWVVMPGYD